MPKLRLVAAEDAGVPPKFSPVPGTPDDTGTATVALPKLSPGAGPPKPVEATGVDAGPKAKPGLANEAPKLNPL